MFPALRLCLFSYVCSFPRLPLGSPPLPVASSDPQWTELRHRVRFLVAQRAANTMALPYKKDLDKYRDMDEDELLNKLSAEELKQLETALEEIDPEVSGEHRPSGALPVAGIH